MVLPSSAAHIATAEPWVCNANGGWRNTNGGKFFTLPPLVAFRTGRARSAGRGSNVAAATFRSASPVAEPPGTPGRPAASGTACQALPASAGSGPAIAVWEILVRVVVPLVQLIAGGVVVIGLGFG